MIAIHPWLRGAIAGFFIFCFALSYGFDNACFLVTAACIFVSMKLSKQQQAYEEELLFQKRLYNMQIEQVFGGLQRALSNVWLNESHWHNRMTEFGNGYMLYRYEWREPESCLDDGTRRHANLQIECTDCSDLEGDKTVVAFSYDGLPNVFNKRTFYDAVHLAMTHIDAYLPEHTVLKCESGSNAVSASTTARQPAAYCCRRSPEKEWIMSEHYQQYDSQQPYFYDLWQVHQGRGVLAQTQERYEDAVVQYSIAAFVLIPEGQPMAQLCRAHSLVSLAYVYVLMERYDRAVPLLHDVITLRQDLLPQCHPLTAETNHLMANALRGLKRYADADWYYRQATDCLFQLLPPEDRYLKQVIGNWLVSDAAWNATNDLANLNDAGQSA